jgi:hypothetical protein
VAAPIFRRIAEPALDYLGVSEDGSAARPPDLAALGAGLPPPSESGAAGEVVPAAYTTHHPADRSGSSGGAGPRPSIDPVAPRPLTFDDGGATSTAPLEGSMNVPFLSGAPLRDAVIELARAGLVASVEGDGFVVTQSPQAGTPVTAGSLVSLKLGRFVETVAREIGPAPAPLPARPGAAVLPSSPSAGKSRQKGGGRSAHDH